MQVQKVRVRNFRMLKDSELTFEKSTTVIVGRNNSGKTTLTEVFRRFLIDTNPKFNLEDFSLSCHQNFCKAFLLWKHKRDNKKVREYLPFIDITLTFNYDLDCDELGPVGEFIIDMDSSSSNVIVNLRYELKNGKIDELFANVNYSNDKKLREQEIRDFFRIFKDRIPKLFTTNIVSIDPGDEGNRKPMELKEFKLILQTGFINAQRGLDDVTNKERDVLGKVIEKMFDIAQTGNGYLFREDFDTISALEDAVKDIQRKLDTDFNDHLNLLLPSLSLFGYPGLNNTSLQTETILDVKRLLENHTKVRYPGNNGFTLPEAYNGLGSRNLIYILLQLYEFFKSYMTQIPSPNFHLIFIEEPEAHLHPQMQEVFIRKINEIAEEFCKRFSIERKWPVQFIITTHSTHIANEASFDSIRYFLSTRSLDGYLSTRIKDLKNSFSEKTPKETKEFLHKYLTLTKCDLFFADKAILVEGATERLLLPKMIEKLDEGKQPDETLSSRYMSIIEVSGAYAHHFIPLINFLELKTLIITDIDSVKICKTNNKKRKSRNKCVVAEGLYTSNACIKNWFSNDVSIKELLIKTEYEKTKEYVRIAYQVPEVDLVISDATHALNETAVAVTEEETDKSFINEQSSEIQALSVESRFAFTGRSFEDAFMLANRTIFDLNGNKPEEFALDAWNKAQKISKTEFALKYAIEETEWNIPLYIKEGLMWLSICTN